MKAQIRLEIQSKNVKSKILAEWHFLPSYLKFCQWAAKVQIKEWNNMRHLRINPDSGLKEYLLDLK